MPKVSVLIPTYNMASFLDEAIHSVLNQTYDDYELIIIDNASTDHTDEVVSKYLYHTKIKYYKNNNNLGMTKNWNKCLLVAKGEYIKFLNADDKLHKDNLKSMSLILDKAPNVALVTSWRELFGNQNNVLKQNMDKFVPKDLALKLSLNEGNWIGEPTTVMFRHKNIYLGLFDTTLNWLPDWDMWLRQLTIGDLYIIPKTLSYFRIHDGQATHNLMKNYSTIFEEYSHAKTLCSRKVFDIPDDTYNSFLQRTIFTIAHFIPDVVSQKKYSTLKEMVKIIYCEGYSGYTLFFLFKIKIRALMKMIYNLFIREIR